MVFLVAFVACQNPPLKGVPKHFEYIHEQPVPHRVAAQAEKVCAPDNDNQPTKNLELCRRWDYAEAYGRGVNAWRGEEVPE